MSLLCSLQIPTVHRQARCLAPCPTKRHTVVPRRCRVRAEGENSKLAEQAKEAESKLKAKEGQVKQELKNTENVEGEAEPEAAETKRKLEESLKTIESLKKELAEAKAAAKKE